MFASFINRKNRTSNPSAHPPSHPSRPQSNLRPLRSSYYPSPAASKHAYYDQSPGAIGVPSASTEDAPPRKRTRVLQRQSANIDGIVLRTHSAHASLHSSASGKLSKARSVNRAQLPSTGPPGGSSSRGGGNKPPSQKRFPCQRCDAVFAQNGQLSRHVRRVHDKLRPFACEHCGRLFGARSDRSRHVTIVHKKVRQFPCERCGFEFQAKTHLEAHVRTVHDGQRPYSCNQCGFSFGLRSNLLTHQRAVHEKEAKWICPTCQTAFNRKHDMHRHQKLMHEGSPASASASRKR
ncbi:unnamed protein product [Chondrus crispus]|uniref:C2H2-type domain-containing protein n=1 Tax=Chondrus crispus TaxID=2769 RepID=R7Q3T1_CHOCR|nr:unnamed protein product [Chondrus crispus]CDF32513.1 unnamed protein product [Chondrus crispus]|eukprot:XP_005712178.1 unnamed protein product [Chondrus crispus]